MVFSIRELARMNHWLSVVVVQFLWFGGYPLGNTTHSLSHTRMELPKRMHVSTSYHVQLATKQPTRPRKSTYPH